MTAPPRQPFAVFARLFGGGDTLAFERGLAAALGMKVEIEGEAGNPEAGRLIVHYQKLEQLDELAKKLSRR